jgi:HSP20 family protein
VIVQDRNASHVRVRAVGAGSDPELLLEVDMMLMRTDPFRELDRLSRQIFGSDGTLARPAAMPIDAWRDGDVFVIKFDIPGVSPEAIELDVERNVVTR